MIRCTKCILPETTPNISFDAQGVCNYCLEQKRIIPHDDAELTKVFKKYKGDKYDCILGLSGGRDSSYALYLLTQKYNMHVLAVHYKSALSHEQGTINAIQMAKAFDVELIIITDKNNIHEKCFCNNIRAYSKKQRIAMISMMCVACKTKWIDIYKIAKSRKINLIVAASNPYESTSFKRAFQGIRSDSKHVYLRKLFKGLVELVRNPRYINGKTIVTTLRAYLYLNSKSPFLKIRYPKMRKIDIFYYTDWDENRVISTIRKYGWEKPADEISTWRFDCLAGKIKDYVYFTKYGFTEKDDLYSQMIRNNKLSRKEAIQRIEVENILDEEKINNILSRCGLSINDLT